jgi:NAD(P)-dependent dehydrogenase (short-subunit alcohol dehydrogenase family)
VVTRVADVRDRSALAEALAEGVTELGRLDVVVANAGISPLGPTVPRQGWFDTVSINFGGVLNTVEIAYPHLGAGASIICIGSMASLLAGSVDSPAAGPGGAGYAHAKRAVARLVHDLALQLAPENIRVNAIHPGNIDTDMLHNDALYRLFRPDLENPTREDVEPSFRATHKLPVTTIEPAAVSEAVVFLASDASRYTTGQQLKVDAGALLPTTNSGAPA